MNNCLIKLITVDNENTGEPLIETLWDKVEFLRKTDL